MTGKQSGATKETFSADQLEAKTGYPPEPEGCLNLVVGSYEDVTEPFPDDIDNTTQGHPPEPYDHCDLVVDLEDSTSAENRE